MIIGNAFKNYFNKIKFVLTNTAAPAEGEMNWNSDDGTLQIGMPGGDIALQIGQEMHIRVTNDETTTITNGTPVYVSGSTGANVKVKKADAATPDNTRKTIAVATEDIAKNQKGYVTTFGMVRDINTAGCTAGDELFVAAGGGFTKTRPALPNGVTKIGYCLHAHATEGLIFVNTENKSMKDILTDTGDLTIKTVALKTVIFEQSIYDDFVPSVSVEATGGASPDVVNHTIQGVLGSYYSFDGAATEERLTIKIELYHGYKEGTDIEVHVHAMPNDNTAGDQIWYFDYFVSKINSAPVAGSTLTGTNTILLNTQYYDYTKSLGTISGSGLKIGDFIIGTLRRTPTGADTYGGEMLLKQVAAHCEMDTLGSRQRYIK